MIAGNLCLTAFGTAAVFIAVAGGRHGFGVYDGLPVGPIANPGALSLEAALYPVEHEYLFYHTNEEKKDGSHIFTKTYQEHVNTQ